MCVIASSVPHRANRYFQVIDAIRRKLFSRSSIIHHWRSPLHLRSHRFGSLKPIVRDANVGSQRLRRALCLDGRSHDRLAQRSSGLRMLRGPSPPGNIGRSVASPVVGTPAPHAAAPYRASGFVLWHFSDVTAVLANVCC